MNVLTVNPRGIFPPLPRYMLRGSVRLLSTKIFKHSAQKSNNFWPSPCFCSSVRRYFDCVISNFPSPWTVTKHTRRLVPPKYNPIRIGEGHMEYESTEINSEVVAFFLACWPTEDIGGYHRLKTTSIIDLDCNHHRDWNKKH